MLSSVVSQVLRRGLYTRVVGRRIMVYPSLASTMDRAAEEARGGTSDGTVILTEQQTTGRGRFQRLWVSTPGNLLLSIVLYPSHKELPYLSIAASLAVVRTIESETNLRPSLKWPNDVLIGGKKVCGLLVENALEGQDVSYAVIGIGLNVALDPKESPEIAAIATGLNVEAGKTVDCALLLRRLLQELDNLYQNLREGLSLVGEWRGYLETLGKRVEVRWGHDIVAGYAEDVDEMGHLILRTDDGNRITLSAGEVSLSTAQVYFPG